MPFSFLAASAPQTRWARKHDRPSKQDDRSVECSGGIPGRKNSGSSLIEAMLALSLVAFAFVSLFMIYSTGLGMVRTQQETIHATLLLEERCAALRGANWSVLSNADRLQQMIYQAVSPAEAHLP